MIVKIKLNQNLSTPKGKLKKDDVVNIECCNAGIPLDKFWRNRFVDSKIDNCLSIVVDEPAEKSDKKNAKNSINKNKKDK